VQTCIVRGGFLRSFGNKGGVVVRFDLQQTPVICACCHFTSGQEKYHDRLRNWLDIIEQSFENKDNKYQFDSHQIKFIFGDLNFRIHSKYDEVINELGNVKEGNKADILSALFKQDQLTLLGQHYEWLNDYEEMPIDFMPTYKYDPGTDVYDTSKKRRTPSW
jgi:hypothetical protein